MGCLSRVAYQARASRTTPGVSAALGNERTGRIDRRDPLGAQSLDEFGVSAIWNAETRTTPRPRPTCFAADNGTTWPKAAVTITHDLEVPLPFYD